MYICIYIYTYKYVVGGGVALGEILNGNRAGINVDHCKKRSN